MGTFPIDGTLRGQWLFMFRLLGLNPSWGTQSESINGDQLFQAKVAAGEGAFSECASESF